jgi:hypothetical protein
MQNPSEETRYFTRAPKEPLIFRGFARKFFAEKPFIKKESSAITLFQNKIRDINFSMILPAKTFRSLLAQLGVAPKESCCL